MKFKLGFALGFAAGHWVASTPPEERRAKLDDALSGVRDNPRLQRVTETVARDARRLGDLCHLLACAEHAYSRAHCSC